MRIAALYDIHGKQLMRTGYDVEAAAAVLLRSRFPGVPALVGRLRAPATALEMLEAYSKVEIAR
jgi:hypothetical protein